MRSNLKAFRAKKNLNQEQMSNLLGISRITYSAIETGERRGSSAFWERLQAVFNVPNADMWELTLNEGATECVGALKEK